VNRLFEEVDEQRKVLAFWV